MLCSYCSRSDYKTWQGSDPSCAFTTGAFSSDNWNCGVVNVIRPDFSDPDKTPWRWDYRHDDSSYGVMFVDLNDYDAADDWQAAQGGVLRPRGVLYMDWYKRRGRCDEMRWVDRLGEGAPAQGDTAVTLDEAEQIAAWIVSLKIGEDP